MAELIPFKNREVKHCPPHFILVPLVERVKAPAQLSFAATDDVDEQRREIRNWLHENVSNRFFIGYHTYAKSGYYVESFSVGFEDPTDATYFSLMRPKFT